jgi:hypothetical protein
MEEKQAKMKRNLLDVKVIGFFGFFFSRMYMNKLWKESLNTDGQQFYQYQQNEQSPLTSIHWPYKILRHKHIIICHTTT